MRLAIAEDAALFREGLARLLADAGHEIVAAVGDAEVLLEVAGREALDAAGIDIRMPPSHTDEGLVAALSIRERHPAVGVLVRSQYVETHHAVQLLAADPRGVGYLLKDRVSNIGEFLEALQRVGKRRLGDRSGRRLAASPAKPGARPARGADRARAGGAWPDRGGTLEPRYLRPLEESPISMQLARMDLAA